MDSTRVTSEQLASLGTDARADFLRYRQSAWEAFQAAFEARQKACCAKDPVIREEWDHLAHCRAESAETWDWLAMHTLNTAG